MTLLDDILSGLGVVKKEEIPGKGFLADRSREVLASLPLPLVVCDKRLQILGATPIFVRLLGLNEEKLEKKTLFQILGNHVKIVEGHCEKPLTSLPDVIKQRNPKLLIGNFPKIGLRSFHLFTRRIPPNFLIIFVDITDEKELAGKIEKSRSELLSVFDGIDDPLVMIDKNFRIRRINEAMLKVLGATSYQGFIGKACYYMLHGRRDICSGCTAGKTLSTGQKTQRLGLLAGRRSADEFSYQITCYPLKDSLGSVTGIAEAYRDVTDVRRTEEELYESERSRIMEPLAAGIAHEIRNPLAIIRSTAQYCLGEVGQDNHDLRESLQTIVRNTEQANRVIGNLLDFARPSLADFKRQPLRPLLQKALGLIKTRARSQKVRLVPRIPGNLSPLILEGNRFVQAIMNFLVNSLDAMPRGGRLEIEAHHQNGSRTATVTIRDSGEGIPEEILPKILQPFYSTKKDGVGLGLPIAEGIIRSHGGRVQFKSRRGKGTEVRITVPIRKKLPATLLAGFAGGE